MKSISTRRHGSNYRRGPLGGRLIRHSLAATMAPAGRITWWPYMLSNCSFQAWLCLARHSGVSEALAFADTVERHLEGANNMIKTTRRCAYGFRDTQYFFSRIYENSRKPSQIWLSHKNLYRATCLASQMAKTSSAPNLSRRSLCVSTSRPTSPSSIILRSCLRPFL